MNRKNIFRTLVVAVLLVGMLSSFSVVADNDMSLTTRGKPARDTLVVSIVNPADGATVSDSVTISVTVTDPEGIYNNLVADLYIDGTFVVSANSYVWDTAAYDNGNVEIRAYAEQPRAKGKPVKVVSDEDTAIVTVDNYVEPPPAGDGDDLFTGTVSNTNNNKWHYFDAGFGMINAELSWGTSYDVDMYLYRPSDYVNYVVRAYTTSNPETMSYNANEAGLWGIKVVMYTSSGSNTNYELHVTYTPNTPDVTDPTCTITAPTNGQVVYKTTYVKATATDDRNIDHVDFFVDGSLAFTDSVSPFSFAWDTTSVANGGHTLGATAYDGANNFDVASPVTVTVDQSAAPATDVQKYAVIVGISDYKAINDLSYCDEDASDWYDFVVADLLVPTDHITVLGDTHSNNYPQYDGVASEANIKAALNNYVTLADEDDELFFITSGHGSGDGRGSSYICAWDCGSGESGEDGDFYDTELAAIMGDAIADKIFIFIDHCYSGGFGPELMALANAAHIYCATTCTDNGYGWDDPTSQNGLWTHWFLEASWISHFGSDPNTPLEDVFTYAHDNYTKGGGDEPQEFDGDSSSPMVI